MNRYGVSGFILASFCALAPAIEEQFCTVPANCVDDVMNIRFPANGSTSEIENVAVDALVDMNVTIDVKSTPVQGFSYGVQHDKAFLDIQTATHRGTDPEIANAPDDGGAEFRQTLIGQDKLGFIQAIVITLDQLPPFELPIRNGIWVAKVQYKAVAPVPAAGTKISFSNTVSPPGSPPTATNLTISGKSKQPNKVNSGLVKGAPVAECTATTKPFAFYFGGAANDAAFAIPAGAADVKIGMRNQGTEALGFSLGIKKTGANLTFESTLGAPAVELVITRLNGQEVNGDALKGNTATGAPANAISAVVKGAALAGITGDFFGPRIVDAAEGGPGATVGYVVDATGNNRTIPATADNGAVCGVQEILAVQFGAPVIRFSRGDANGDGKLNVTDGVVVAQNIFAAVTRPNLIFFDCKDMLDINDDGQLNTADPVFLLTYIFLKGPQPAAPFRACAQDPTTTDTLGCIAANCT